MKGLYEEPDLSDIDQKNLDKLLKQFGQTHEGRDEKKTTDHDESWAKVKLVKKDNTAIKISRKSLNKH